jgi:hypothetical protein
VAGGGGATAAVEAGGAVGAMAGGGAGAAAVEANGAVGSVASAGAPVIGWVELCGATDCLLPLRTQYDRPEISNTKTATATNLVVILTAQSSSGPTSHSAAGSDASARRIGWWITVARDASATGFGLHAREKLCRSQPPGEPATCLPRSCSSLVWINAAVGDLRKANVLPTGADLGRAPCVDPLAARMNERTSVLVISSVSAVSLAVIAAFRVLMHLGWL